MKLKEENMSNVFYSWEGVNIKAKEDPEQYFYNQIISFLNDNK